MRIVVPILLCLSLGCGPATLPSPEILSVSPSQVLETDALQLTIELDAFLNFEFDYGTRTVEVFPNAQVTLGGMQESTVLPVDGPVHVTFPDMAPGTYDLTITMEDGRTATQAGALTVVAAPRPTGYLIDPIAAQVRGAPFSITVRAQGSAAPNFNGILTIRSNKGTVNPGQVGPFAGGVRTESVSVTAVDQAMILTVEDSAGVIASSNSFGVTP